MHRETVATTYDRNHYTYISQCFVVMKKVFVYRAIFIYMHHISRAKCPNTNAFMLQNSHKRGVGQSAGPLSWQLLSDYYDTSRSLDASVAPER